MKQKVQVLPEVKKVERPAKKDPSPTAPKDVIVFRLRQWSCEGIEATRNAPDIRAKR